MTAFDGVLIGAIVTCVVGFIALIHDKSTTRKLTLLTISFCAMGTLIAGICASSFHFGWESTILHNLNPPELAATPTIEPTAIPTGAATAISIITPTATPTFTPTVNLTAIPVVTQTFALVDVPNVIGMEQMEATNLLTERGLNFQVWWTEENNMGVSHYYIKNQSIPAGSRVSAGTLIKLELSASSVIVDTPNVVGTLVNVPGVIGMEQMEATELLTQRGLDFQVWWTEENNIEVDHYYIKDQSIPAGSEVPYGTLIELELSIVP